MQNQTQAALLQEWSTLQNNYEQSEALALAIKLLAVVVTLVGFIFSLSTIVISALLLVLWLQEAIWKTFQGRTEQRLLTIEQARLNNDASSVLSFYSTWSASRPGQLALIKEYISNAIRPTVAYPYIVLLPIYCLL